MPSNQLRMRSHSSFFCDGGCLKPCHNVHAEIASSPTIASTMAGDICTVRAC